MRENSEEVVPFYRPGSLNELLEARLALDAADVPYEVFGENVFFLNPRSHRGATLEIRVPRSRFAEALEALREDRIA
ncbi:MAG TPA: hypothetical protein VM778_13930 [Gemmatimonadota bacterium]|nr:hypothetical protein [Gemmatimonadota bacterium]